MTSGDDVSTSASAPPKVDPQVSIAKLVSPPAAVPTRSYKSLARRISSRTTDLLAIAIVLIGGLTLGRQILCWWTEGPPAAMDLGPLENASTEWGSNAHPVMLRFGNSPVSLTRQVFTEGGPQRALDAVRNHCQGVLLQTGLPQTPADKAELDQLRELSKLTPDAEQPGDWQLYTLDSGLVMVVGTKFFPSPTGNPPPASPQTTQRVICWALVFPGISQGSWVSWTFVKQESSDSSSPRVSADSFDLNRLELPPGSQRTVLMQEADQGGVLGFQGVDGNVAWQRHFRKWFTEQGWTQVADWQSLGKGWSGRFDRREAGDETDSTVHVQFHPQENGRGSGLIHWMPGRKAVPTATHSSSRGTP